MVERASTAAWRPSTTSLVAGAMVITGFALTGLSWWFLLLAAMGTFGPGVLRELGWLTDKDEFQLRAAYRAGYHAYVAAGIVAFLLMAFFRSGERGIKDPQELATFFLALLWFTWFLSSLLAYWGPQKTAARILYGFGCVWLAFTIVSNLGQEWTTWAALLLHPLLALPFFVMAWLASRCPRVTGVLLLATSIFFVWFFGWFRGANRGLINDAVTFILFVGPLIASSVALLGGRPEEGSGDLAGQED